MKINFSPVYQFFAPVDGFGEFITILCLTLVTILAWTHRLTEAYAACLTAINVSGVAHDHLTGWLEQRAKVYSATGVPTVQTTVNQNAA